MVLHDSKWDRKATRRYHQKHGTVPEHVARKQREQEKERQRAQARLGSNVWRYGGREEDDEKVREQVRKRQEVNDLLEGDSDRDIEDDASDSDVDESATDDGESKKQQPAATDGERAIEDLTLAQAALRPEQDQVGEFRPQFFPEAEDELAEIEQLEEDRKIVNSNSKTLFDSKKESKVVAHDNPEEFWQIQQGIERAKVTNDLKTKFKVKNKPRAPVPLEGNEDDFDDFLNEIDSSTSKLVLDESQDQARVQAPSLDKLKDTQEWLDDLLN